MSAPIPTPYAALELAALVDEYRSAIEAHSAHHNAGTFQTLKYAEEKMLRALRATQGADPGQPAAGVDDMEAIFAALNAGGDVATGRIPSDEASARLKAGHAAYERVFRALAALSAPSQGPTAGLEKLLTDDGIAQTWNEFADSEDWDDAVEAVAVAFGEKELDVFHSQVDDFGKICFKGGMLAALKMVPDCPVPAAPAAPVDDRDESGWLLEYPGLLYVGTEPGKQLDRTKDHNKAIRFARKEDAQAMFDALCWILPGFFQPNDNPPTPVEHVWVKGAPPPVTHYAGLAAHPGSASTGVNHV